MRFGFLLLLLILGTVFSNTIPEKVKEKLYQTAVNYYEKGNYVGALELFNYLGSFKNSTSYRGRLIEFFTDAPSPSIFGNREPFVRLKAAADFKEVKVNCPSGTFSVKVYEKTFHLGGITVKGSLTFNGSGCSLTVDGEKMLMPPRSKVNLLFYRGKPLLIVRMPLEIYLVGVLPGEVYMSWNDAALKAQAVAARTFALYNLAKRRNLPYDLDGTTLFQNFVGFKGINPKAEEIVRETRGEVLLFNGKLIYAMYSANDGGCSHSFEELFGINLPYLSTTEDGKLCNLSNLKRSFWQKGITSEDLRNFLNSVGLTDFQPITFRVLRNGCGRGLRITFVSTDEREITFPLAFFVRLSLHLPSDWFYAERKGNGYFALKGKGFGHGLGMSQWGAYCLGEKGWNYKKILEFFYRGAVVKKIY